MSDQRESRWEWLLLAVVLLLAATLRFYFLQGAEFQWDQAEISKWAQAVVHERRGAEVRNPRVD